MANFRVKTSFVDNTQTVSPTGTVFGASAIISTLKGPTDWRFVGKQQPQTLIDLFGVPSVTNPGIQDLIDANATADLYVTAPVGTGGLYGGVFVTSAGTIPFGAGSATQSFSSYSAIPATQTVGVGNGVTLSYTATLVNYKYYNPASLTFTVNGSPLTMTESSASGVETYTGTGVSATYTIATGVLTITWTSAPTGSIVVGYTFNIASIVYFTLFDKFPQVDDIAVKVTPIVSAPGNFTINIYRYSVTNGQYNEIPGSPVTVGLTANAVDANGVNVYLQNVFDNNQVLFTATIQNTIFTTMTADTTSVPFAGGSRGATPANTDIATAYEALKDTLTYPVKVIFDTTAFPEVAQEFVTLRGTDTSPGVLSRVRFLLPTTDAAPSLIIATPATYNNGANSRGIYYYCLTWGIHSNIYTGVTFNCSNMGLIAGKVLAMLINGPGGAPAWQDENGIGGQLGGSILKLNQKALDSELQQLDALHFNAVVIHPSYGPMITDARTSLSIESDYSWISASSIADWVTDIIETQILPAQIFKFNDAYHQNIVKSKTDTVMRGLAPYFESYAVKCDDTNNTPDIKNARKFVLTVGVVFTKDSAYIELVFVNSPSGTDVTQVINKTSV